MKKILLAIGFMFLFGTVVEAADIQIRWDTVANADGYVLSHSTDDGVTWSASQDVLHVNAVLYTVPDSGLVLIRVGAYNSIGTTWREDAGVFYNGDWTPLPPPTGVGIQ